MDTIKSYITSIPSIPIIDPQSFISTVIPKTGGSHYPAYVYDKKTFLGLVWPYHLIFAKRPKQDVKVKHLIVHPPKITSKTPLYEVCEYMVGMRLYILPVFDAKSKVIGSISATTILKRLLADSLLVKGVEQNIEYIKPLIVDYNWPIKNVYPLMKKNNQSRALLVDSKGKLAGIISRRDIYMTLIEPAKNKQRYKTGGQGNRFLVFDTDWTDKLDYQVKELASEDVLYDSEKQPLAIYIKQMLNKKSGSIIITDKNMRPRSFISRRSILKALAQLKPENKIPVTFTDKNRIVSAFRKMELDELVEKFIARIQTHLPVTRVELLVDGIKNRSHIISKHTIALHVIMARGKSVVVKTIHKNLRTALQMAITKITHQLKKV